MRETELYPTIKSFFERLGYEVKAEVASCDVVAKRVDEPPVVIEIKTGLTLQLFYQAVDRLALTETVYVAVPKPKRALPREAAKLCRRLGLGLLVISNSGNVEVLAEPEPYRPRPNVKRKAALLKEFKRRKGDPNIGGSTRTKLMTAYKQDALRLLAHIKAQGPSKLADLRAATKVDRAANILRDDYYGWFERRARGVYGPTEVGISAFAAHSEHILDLQDP